jgi:hypothetical protein
MQRKAKVIIRCVDWVKCTQALLLTCQYGNMCSVFLKAKKDASIDLTKQCRGCCLFLRPALFVVCGPSPPSRPNIAYPGLRSSMQGLDHPSSHFRGVANRSTLRTNDAPDNITICRYVGISDKHYDETVDFLSMPNPTIQPEGYGMAIISLLTHFPIHTVLEPDIPGVVVDCYSNLELCLFVGVYSWQLESVSGAEISALISERI